MQTPGRFRPALLRMAILLSAVLLPTLGYADIIDLRLGQALGNTASVSLTEGDLLTLTIKVTNVSGAPVTPLFLFDTIFPPTQPDTSDYGALGISAQQTGDACGLFGGNPVTLANGATCSFVGLMGTDNLVGEVGFDSGVSLNRIGLQYRTQNGALVLTNLDITTTVNDPTPVPEPAYSMLLGLAITACVLFRRPLMPGSKPSA